MYHEVLCHMIFHIKSDLTDKARFNAGGHLMEDVPSIVTYSSVVARDSIRILLVLAALNRLDVICTDIQGAFCMHNRVKRHVSS